MPPAYLQCAATDECTTYAWAYEPFQECATACGQPESEQTRSITCMDSDGSVINDASCDGETPAITQVCPATSACVSA